MVPLCVSTPWREDLRLIWRFKQHLSRWQNSTQLSETINQPTTCSSNVRVVRYILPASHSGRDRPRSRINPASDLLSPTATSYSASCCAPCRCSYYYQHLDGFAMIAVVSSPWSRHVATAIPLKAIHVLVTRAMTCRTVGRSVHPAHLPLEYGNKI
jgi:hypothetical protein